MPEAYKTSLVMTINARSLQNFLELRSSKHALWEIQYLAKAMYDAIPEEHKFLYESIYGS
jgi:thymidylate synthase (FAD)